MSASASAPRAVGAPGRAAGAWAPVTMAAVLSIALSAVGQVHELYRGFAQEIAFRGVGIMGWPRIAEWDPSLLLRPMAQFAALAVSALVIAFVAAAALRAGPARKSASLAAYLILAVPMSALLLGVHSASLFIEKVGAHQFAAIFDATTADATPLTELSARAQMKGSHFVDRTPYLLMLGFGAVCGLAVAPILWGLLRIGAAVAWRRLDPRARLAIGLAPLLCFAAVSLVDPVGPARGMGTFVIAGSALALFAIIFQAASEIRLAGWLNLAQASVIVAIVFAALKLNHNHDLRPSQSPPARTTAEAQSGAPISLNTAFEEWWATRLDRPLFKARGERYPVFVAAGQGGGIYSAAHLTHLLSGLEDSCALFPHHLFATIGVSGGSVGTALYRAGVELSDSDARRRPQNAGSADAYAWIREGACDKSTAGQFSETEVGGLFADDFFAPVLAGLLYTDFVQHWTPVPVPEADRSFALESAFLASWDAARSKFDRAVLAGLASEPLPALPFGGELAAPFETVWAPAANPLGFATIFNTTNVRTGRRTIISPFLFGAADARFLPVWQRDCWTQAASAASTPQGPSLMAAALASARFPLITPTASASLRLHAECGRDDAGIAGAREAVSLADGGYFENSGTSTALDLVRGLAAAAKEAGVEDEIVIHMVATRTNAGEPSSFLQSSELFGPLLALTSTRGARSAYEIDRMHQYYLRQRGSATAGAEDATNGDEALLGDYIVVTLDLTELPLPLGWHLAYGTRELIAGQANDEATCDEASEEKREWLAAGRAGALSGVCAMATITEHIRN